MRKFLIALFLLPVFTVAQVAKDYAVLLSCDVNESPAQITLKWPSSAASTYFVYKKLKSEANFGSSFEVLPGSATSYTDTSVQVGISYEYYVKQNASVSGYGYINCGIKTTIEDNGVGVKGKLLLLLDSNHVASLNSEIDILINDLEGEGWTVIRKEFSPSKAVTDVKQFIVSEYSKDPSNVRSVFLLGHLPVPYSGNLAPDGHPDHVGAWPADAFYGDVNGSWTDNLINTTTASDPRNRNIPGDGKYDASVLPSAVELQVGRVDFYDMPAFGASETELLRQYLNKNHAFRVKEIQARPRALIDDNFGGFSGEAFAASAWKAFSTFFGPDSIYSSDYRTDLNKASYLWSYGCGGGTYTSAGGIGNTTQLATDSLQTIFTALFGSYFGDWDKTDNFLRAPLAQGLALTSAWSGRPHWYFHHMGLGENIGYSQHEMVNTNPYYQHYGTKFVHIALMGDPTLTMHIVSPPSNLLLTEADNHVDLVWTASTDNIVGYNVYRKDSLYGIYHRVNDGFINGTVFTDVEFDRNGTYYYSVRAVKLEETPSGSYYNLSGGALGEIQTVYTGVDLNASHADVVLFPNPNKGNFQLKINGVTGQYSLNIMSVEGKLVFAEKFQVESPDFIKEVAPENLKAGVYFVELMGEGSREVRKLIVR